MFASRKRLDRQIARPRGATRPDALRTPRIVVDSKTGLGDGRSARVLIQGVHGDTALLACWIPNGVTRNELVGQVQEALTTHKMDLLLARVVDAKVLPVQRNLSGAAASYRNAMLGASVDSIELMGTGSTSRAPQVSRKNSDCQDEIRPNRIPTPRSAAAALTPNGPPRLTTDCSCYEMDGLIWFDGDSWHIDINFDYCNGDDGGDYIWMIENDYWAFACGDSTPDRDTILKQYTNASPKMYDSTAFGADTGLGSMPLGQRPTAHWTPGCGDLINYWPNPYPLPFDSMKDHTANYTIAFLPLTGDTSGHWGFPWWIKLLKDSIGNVRANSVYRTPHHQYLLTNPPGRGAKGSSHVRGVAADMGNLGGSADTVQWLKMRRLATQAQASYLEPLGGPCKTVCAHADWRWWVTWPH